MHVACCIVSGFSYCAVIVAAYISSLIHMRLRVDLDAEDLRRFAKHQAELAMSDGSPRMRRARRRQRVRETLSTVAEEPAVSDHSAVAEEPAVSDRSATAISANNMTYATKDLDKYKHMVRHALEEVQERRRLHALEVAGSKASKSPYNAADGKQKSPPVGATSTHRKGDMGKKRKRGKAKKKAGKKHERKKAAGKPGQLQRKLNQVQRKASKAKKKAAQKDRLIKQLQHQLTQQQSPQAHQKMKVHAELMQTHTPRKPQPPRLGERGNWECIDYYNINFAFRSECFRCGEPRAFKGCTRTSLCT